MAQTTLKKENNGYNYKYTDLAQINGWCEANGIVYSQVITIIDGLQYISTSYTKGGKEYGPYLGAQVIKAAPGGKVNEAQIYGSGLTYARRYSLLMCFGLATDDDDAQCYTQAEETRQQNRQQQTRQQTIQEPARQPQAQQSKTSVTSPAQFANELAKMKADNGAAYNIVRDEMKKKGWNKPSDIPEEEYEGIRAAYKIAKIDGSKKNNEKKEASNG